MCYDNNGRWIGCYAPEYCDAEPPEQSGPRVHLIEAEAADRLYAVTQCGYLDEDGAEVEIRDGDVFVAPSTGVIGFLCEAWPVALMWPTDDANPDADPPGGLHAIQWETRDTSPEHPASQYEESILKACEIAEADADVTGNDHWQRQSDAVKVLLGVA